MNFQQPKPDSIKYSDLIREIQRGFIKIPKFQCDFVWGLDKTAKLLDSILKGYPIDTFIFWQTAERINDIKNIGVKDLPDTPLGHRFNIYWTASNELLLFSQPLVTPLITELSFVFWEIA